MTEEKISTQALGESEERYRRLVQNIPDYVLVFSLDRIIFANPATASAVGKRIEELSDTSVYDFIAPEYWEIVRKNTLKTMNGEPVEPYEIEIRVPDMPRRIAIMNTTLLRYQEQRVILAVLHPRAHAMLRQLSPSCAKSCSVGSSRRHTFWLVIHWAACTCSTSRASTPTKSPDSYSWIRRTGTSN